jgi:hypothetical protein
MTGTQNRERAPRDLAAAAGTWTARVATRTSAGTSCQTTATSALGSAPLPGASRHASLRHGRGGRGDHRLIDFDVEVHRAPLHNTRPSGRAGGPSDDHPPARDTIASSEVCHPLITCNEAATKACPVCRRRAEARRAPPPDLQALRVRRSPPADPGPRIGSQVPVPHERVIGRFQLTS